MSFGPIVWSIVAVLVALVLLALLALPVLRAAVRTTTVLGAFTALVSDRGGLLRARLAGLRVRAGRRGQTGDSSGSPEVDWSVTVPVTGGAPQ